MAPQLVERMTMAPNCCMMCGRGNTPNNDGTVGPFVDLAMDYNWGDSGYLCEDCVGKLAVLLGWISPDTQKELGREIKRLQAEIHRLNSEMDMRRERERRAIRKARALA